MKKKARVLLLYSFLGIAGFVFAIGCFIIYISGLVLDLLAFLGLLGVALCSLVYGRVKRKGLFSSRSFPFHRYFLVKRHASEG
jgi:hypothetical protein